CRAAPWIADQPIARAREGAQRLRLLIAARKDERRGLHCAAVIELDVPATVTALRRCRGRVHGSCESASYGVIENFAEIPPEEPPLSEVAAVAPFSFEPLREMIRLARPGAHRFGGHVEQVRRLGCGISHAPP